MGAITGITIGAAVGFGLLALLMWYVWRLRREVAALKDDRGAGPRPEELHGEGVQKHELLSGVKPAQLGWSTGATELPARRDATQARNKEQAEMQAENIFESLPSTVGCQKFESLYNLLAILRSLLHAAFLITSSQNNSLYTS
jgi:hypothetical protein